MNTMLCEIVSNAPLVKSVKGVAYVRRNSFCCGLPVTFVFEEMDRTINFCDGYDLIF